MDIKIIACKECAKQLIIVEALENIGIEVFYAGEFLTNWINSKKNNYSIKYYNIYFSHCYQKNKVYTPDAYSAGEEESFCIKDKNHGYQ